MEDFNKAITDPDFLISLATELKEGCQETERLQLCNAENTRQIEETKPKALFADAVIDHCKGVTVLETPTKGGIQQIKFGKESRRCNGGQAKIGGSKFSRQIFPQIKL